SIGPAPAGELTQLMRRCQGKHPALRLADPVDQTGTARESGRSGATGYRSVAAALALFQVGRRELVVDEAFLPESTLQLELRVRHRVVLAIDQPEIGHVLRQNLDGLRVERSA